MLFGRHPLDNTGSPNKHVYLLATEDPNVAVVLTDRRTLFRYSFNGSRLWPEIPKSSILCDLVPFV